ncbi:MAG: hypothetical exported protein [Marine Group I thaumarchaeote]|nr:MAG: hypothetical exported protein [Marine Group I thaumarchaeote]
MNKLTVPAILVATVMVAGIFAFMPVQQASTVHTTITTDIGTSFRVSSGATALGTQDAGVETFSITCASACIVESIEIWTTTSDAVDIIHIENVDGNVDILRVNLGAPGDDGLGDLAVGGINPGSIHEALRTVGSLLGAADTDLLTPLVITASAGNTVGVDVNNTVDANNNAAIVVIFVGKVLGTVVPTVVDVTGN